MYTKDRTELEKMNSRYFVHEIGKDQAGQMIKIKRDSQGRVLSSTPFKATIYSQMKHGHPESIKTAAKELFEYILSTPTLLDNFLNYDVVVTNSAREVPTASFTIMKCLVENLINPYLTKLGKSPVAWIRSERAGAIASSDYGTMTKEEREKRMAERKPFFSEENKKKLVNKRVIVFDDLVATGTYEKSQSELLISSGVNPNDIIALYWIQINPETGKDPSFEAEVNYFAIKSISDLLPFFYMPDLVINERTLKYIMPTESTKLLEFFKDLGEPKDKSLTANGRSTLMKIYNAGHTNDGFRNMDRLNPGFVILENYLKELKVI